MATTATFDFARSGRRSTHDLRSVLAFFACAGLPLGAFGLVNLGGEAMGILPLYFSPFGLPGWVGAVAHLMQLSLLGMAFWALWRDNAPTAPRAWLIAFTAGYIFLPFVTPPLDSLQLSIVCGSLFLLGLATVNRVGHASGLAGWLMAAPLAIVGFSATMGMVLSAAFTPPFALVQGEPTAPIAA